MSLSAFRIIQAGKEVAATRTEVNADKRFPGTMTLTNFIDRHSPQDDRPSLAEFYRDVDIAQGASLRFQGAATYQQILDFLAMGVKGAIAGVIDSGTAYNWTITPSLTASNVQDSYTFEYGDDTQAWVSVHTMCRALELSFAMNQVTELTADLFSKFATKTTFTSGQVDPVVNEIVSNKLGVAIDSTYALAAATTTPKTALVMGGTLRLVTGVIPIKYADGSMDFSTFGEQRRHLEVELEMAMGADAMTEYDAWAARTLRAIQLKWTGPTLVGANHTFVVNLIGRYVAEPVIFEDRDGQDIIRLIMHSREDTLGNEFGFTCRTNVATL